MAAGYVSTVSFGIARIGLGVGPVGRRRAYDSLSCRSVGSRGPALGGSVARRPGSLGSSRTQVRCWRSDASRSRCRRPTIPSARRQTNVHPAPKPASRARTMACARSTTCSLLKMLEMWFCTVFRLSAESRKFRYPSVRARLKPDRPRRPAPVISGILHLACLLTRSSCPTTGGWPVL